MNIEQDNWIIDFGKKAKNHEDWLKFVRFGFPTLKRNDNLLIRLIINESHRMQKEEQGLGVTVTDNCLKIFQELGITLSIKTTP